MNAYVVVQERVNDAGKFEIYRRQVVATFEAHGGRFVVRGGELTVIEGEWPLPRLVIIEFPSRAAAMEWYNSPEYQAILPHRLKSSVGNFVVVDGI